MNREDDNQTFLNLIVQKIDPSNIQEFIKSWIRQECKDFKLVFIQNKGTSDKEKQAITYACGFAYAIGQSELIAVVASEEEAPKAKITRVLKDTSILPTDKLEVLKMRTEASKQKIENQKIEKLEEKVEQNIKIKTAIENKQKLVEKNDATKMMLQQKPIDTEVSQKKEVEKAEITKSIEKVFFKIIVPNYNNMAYIKKCLDSILEQTFQNFKIIVVDDLSTDGSDKFCEAYAKKYPSKIVFQQVKKKGYAGAARNIGLDYPIECKYILFVDSDDWLYNLDVLKNIHKSILNSKTDVKLIKMAMFHFYGKNDSRNFVKKFKDDLTLEYSFYKGCGPGRTCISSDLAKCKFKENRRVANDVIWHLRCIDNITDKNLLNISFPCQTYNCISLTSGTNLIKKNKKSEEFILSMRLLLKDLKEEVFKTSIVKNIQRNLINLYSLQFPDPKPIKEEKLSIAHDIPSLIKNNMKYELQTSFKTKNKIHVLVVNFGDTISYTRQTINDLLVQTEDFDLTIIDNNSDTFNANQKYFNLLHRNWNFPRRHLHIIGLKKTVALNHIWNSFFEMTSNPWLCFLNNDVCIPENFISDNIKVIEKENNAGIINHATNNPKYKVSSVLDYKIYDKLSNSFMHRQGWDFTICRDVYKKIPEEFSTFVGDCIQFYSAYQKSRDVIFLYSSPIIHYCSTSRKKNRAYFYDILKKERALFLSDSKYKEYGNENEYDVDRNLSLMKPENMSLLKQNVYCNKTDIIVSMTTHSKRIQNIPKVLKSIINQTYKPSKIIINISIEEFKNERSIPDDIFHFIITNNIELNWVKTNTKVYKKIIPTLLKYKNSLVLSIDDDFIYPKTMIEDFYKIYKKNPNSPISGNRITKFGLDCHCGCASLVQYKFYNIYIEDYLKYYEHCPSSDIFFTITAFKNGYKYVRTKDLYFKNLKTIPSSYGYSKGGSINMINITYDWLKKNL